MSPYAQSLILWLIPLAPLASAIVIALLGKRWLKEESHWPCWAALAVSAICALTLLTAIVPHAAHEAGEHAQAEVVARGYEWLSIGAMQIDVDLRADALSAQMLAMVTTVSLLVAIFAAGYMHGDPGYPRFFAAVSLFVFSMCMLVLSGNFLQLFIFWEAVGLCSYLLIGFWFHKPSAAAAAKKAFVVNRIGDLGLILGVLLMWTTFGTLDFSATIFDGEALARVHEADPHRLTWICFLLLAGAMGKSAQFPLHVWLPDAMEGPTPVSALIHAATMVTAGVYLVARSTPLFLFAPTAQLAVSAIGAATALMAGFIALTQFDLKRVLAYSTVSQLGYMFMALGVGAAGAELGAAGVTAGMFHLFTHGFFKGLLFLAAGSVMHSMGDVIDMRRFGGLRKTLPITHATFLCGAAALAGAPLLAGFWSKDEILAALHAAGEHERHGTFFQAVYWIAVGTAALTAFYTFRAYFMTFWGPEKLPEEAGHHPHDAPPAMAWPLRILAVAAVFVGLFASLGHWWGHYIQSSASIPPAGEHGFELGLMAQSAAIALAGIALAWFCYVKSPQTPARVASSAQLLHALSSQKMFWDEIFTALIVKPLRALGRLCYGTDRSLIDRLVDAAGALPRLFSYVPRVLQDGLASSYGLIMWTGLLACLSVMLGLWE